MKNIFKKIKRQRGGYSIIELLIYISLVGATTIIFTAFTADVLKTSAKALTIKEVNQSSRLILSRLTQEIKTAQQINSLTPDSITLTNGNGDVISFSFDNSNKAVNYNDPLGTVPLSNNTVRVTNLGFEQTAPQTITISLTVEQKNPQPSSNQKYQLQLSSTVTPRAQLY